MPRIFLAMFVVICMYVVYLATFHPDRYIALLIALAPILLWGFLVVFTIACCMLIVYLLVTGILSIISR